MDLFRPRNAKDADAGGPKISDTPTAGSPLRKVTTTEPVPSCCLFWIGSGGILFDDLFQASSHLSLHHDLALFVCVNLCLDVLFFAIRARTRAQAIGKAGVNKPQKKGPKTATNPRSQRSGFPTHK